MSMFLITLLFMFLFLKIGQWRASLASAVMMKNTRRYQHSAGSHGRGSWEQLGGPYCLKNGEGEKKSDRKRKCLQKPDLFFSYLNDVIVRGTVSMDFECALSLSILALLF